VTDIVEFIKARVDEDERAAQACLSRDWTVRNGTLHDDQPFDSGDLGIERLRHIARHDPARVLREVEAKRRLLAKHAHVVDGTQSSWTWFEGSESASREVAQLLALPFSDHPDYQEAWRP